MLFFQNRISVIIAGVQISEIDFSILKDLDLTFLLRMKWSWKMSVLL